MDFLVGLGKLKAELRELERVYRKAECAYLEKKLEYIKAQYLNDTSEVKDIIKETHREYLINEETTNPKS